MAVILGTMNIYCVKIISYKTYILSFLVIFFLQCQVLFQAEVCAVPVRTRSDHSDGVHLCPRASATVSTTATGVDPRLCFLNQSQRWILDTVVVIQLIVRGGSKIIVSQNQPQGQIYDSCVFKIVISQISYKARPNDSCVLSHLVYQSQGWISVSCVLYYKV